MGEKPPGTPSRKCRRVLIREMEDENICKIKDISAMMSPLVNGGISVLSGFIINGQREHLAQESLCHTNVTPLWYNDFNTGANYAMKKKTLPVENTLQEDNVKKTSLKLMNDKNICEIKDVSRYDSLSSKNLSSYASRRESAAGDNSKPTSPRESWNEHVKTVIKKQKRRNICEFEENSMELLFTPKKVQKMSNSLPTITHEITKTYNHPLFTKRARTMKKKVARRKVSRNLSTFSDASLSTPALLKNNCKSKRGWAANIALHKTNDSEKIFNDGCQSHLPYSMPKSLLESKIASRSSCVRLNHHFLNPAEDKHCNKSPFICPSFGTFNIQAVLEDKTYQPSVILDNCHKDEKPPFKEQTLSHNLDVSNKHVLAQDRTCQPYVCLVDCFKKDLKPKSQVVKVLKKKQLREISKDGAFSLNKAYQPCVCLVDCSREKDLKSKAQVVKPVGKKQLRELSKASFSIPKDDAFSFNKAYQPYVCLVNCSRVNDLKLKPQVVKPLEKKDLREISKTSFSMPKDDAVSSNKAYQPHVCLVNFSKQAKDLKAKSKVVTSLERNRLREISKASFSSKEDEAVSLDNTYQPYVCLFDYRREQLSAIGLTLPDCQCAKDQVNAISIGSRDCGNHLQRYPGCSFQNEEYNENIEFEDKPDVSIKEELTYDESTYTSKMTQYNPFSSDGYQDAFLSFLVTNRDVVFPKIEWGTY